MSEPAPAPSRSGVVEREQRFFDAKSRSYARVRRWISRAIGAFNRSRDVHDYYDPRGKRILDYGCGEGRFAFRLLEQGAAHVSGIDISHERVAVARKRASELGLAERTDFAVADAHDMQFPDDSFDLVIGSDILHHLDIGVAVRELRRVLKPGGSAVFIEPLAHHPLLRLGRLLTPQARTEDEHPLTEEDWSLCASVFDDFRHDEREFLTIPLMPLNLLLPRRAQVALARRVAPLDDRVLARFPALRKYARRTILVMA